MSGFYYYQALGSHRNQFEAAIRFNRQQHFYKTLASHQTPAIPKIRYFFSDHVLLGHLFAAAASLGTG